MYLNLLEEEREYLSQEMLIPRKEEELGEVFTSELGSPYLFLQAVSITLDSCISPRSIYQTLWSKMLELISLLRLTLD